MPTVFGCGNSNVNHKLNQTSVIVNRSADTPRLPSKLRNGPAGLTSAEAARRLTEQGSNSIIRERELTWVRHLVIAFNNPFILLLSILAALSGLTGDVEAAMIIAAMVIISGILRFTQEYQSNRAAERLKDLVETTATVSRDGVKREVPVDEVVPGDLVHLSAGDMVPADLQLVTAKDLFVSQTALTGESLPVEKTPNGAADTKPTGSDGLADSRLCFMGTNVISGTGMGFVIQTGGGTYLGSIADKVIGKRVETEFDRGIGRVSNLLIRFTLIMAPAVFLLNGWSKGDWMQAFFFALSVAVGLTPEMLPMIVTANLARGAVSMSKRKVIVKRLHSIQNLGAMDVLCSDKTGTLTQDKVILERHLNVLGGESEKVLQLGYLNSYYQTGLKNLLDVAILKHAELEEGLHLATDYRLVDEIPFDFSRRRMSVVVETEKREELLITKGALAEMLLACQHVDINREITALKVALKDRVQKMAHDLNAEGFRVIAVAYRKFPLGRGTYTVADEEELILAGFLAFLDPPKDSAAPAIQALRDHGVAVKIVTGDNEVVTARICRDVGIDVGEIVLGEEVDRLSDGDLAKIASKTSVFARISPMGKARIVQALKQNGHVVGFLGDGINDAPALKQADVGISVNSAVDIAKESADLILLEKSLMVLEEGVIEGRSTFGNILKYIRMGTSSNFGNVFSLIGASLWLPFLPMLPVQLLVQNLLYDISQIGIPFDRMDQEYLCKPRKWDVSAIGRFMLFLGPVSSFFDYATFALLWFFFGARNVSAQSFFQTGWFVEGLLSQTLIVHIIRTRQIPFLESRASAPLALLTTSIMLIGIVLPFTILGTAIGLVPLPWSYFPALIGVLLLYCMLGQVVKNWFANRYGYY